MDDKELYRQILGVVSPWEIETIDLNMDNNRVDIYLQWPYKMEGICPECAVSPVKYMTEEKKGSGGIWIPVVLSHIILTKNLTLS